MQESNSLNQNRDKSAYVFCGNADCARFFSFTMLLALVIRMSIKRVEVYRVILTYKHPFKIASKRNSRFANLKVKAARVRDRIPIAWAKKSYSARNIIIRIITDSEIIGFGEAAPVKRITGETIGTVEETIAKLAPHLVGRPFSDIESNMKLLDSIVNGNPAAKASLDMALHDILGKARRRPLYMLFGGLQRDILTDFSIGIESPRSMSEAAAEAVKKGFKSIKLKVGGHPLEDVQRVKLVRETVGSDIELRVDANGSWTLGQALEVVNKIDRYNIQFVEQPLPADDLRGLIEVRKNSPIPIMADESVCSQKDALHLIQTEATDLINIKLMKSGGILEAMKIARTAEDAKIPCMIGCMMETKIGITAAAHMAGSIKNIVYADLDSDILLEEKLVKKGGATIENSARKLQVDAGLGIIELDEELLGKPTQTFS